MKKKERMRIRMKAKFKVKMRMIVKTVMRKRMEKLASQGMESYGGSQREFQLKVRRV